MPKERKEKTSKVDKEVTGRLDLAQLLQEARKSFSDAYSGLGDDPESKIEKISSGIEVFDNIIGGGLVRGRFHLFTGGFGSGKTYMTQKIVEAAQKNDSNSICVYIDAEKRYEPFWFEKTGVDVSRLIVMRPNFGEEALDMVIMFLNQEVDLIIVDSLAALVPSQEEQDSMEQQSIGLQARMLNKAFRKIAAANKKTVLIGINQQRQEIGNVFHRGIQKTLPGGEGQYYYAALIVEVRRGEWIKNNDGNKIGHEINCLITKCNFNAPYQTCVIPLRYDTGQIDLITPIISLAIDLNLIKRKGGWFQMQGEEKAVQGLAEVVLYYKERPERLVELKGQVFSS